MTDYTTNAHCEFAKVAATDLRNRLCNRCGNQLTRLPGHDNVVRLLVTLSNVGCRVLTFVFLVFVPKQTVFLFSVLLHD